MILSQGAESTIEHEHGSDVVLKKRTPKSYRNPILDKQLLSQRVKREYKVLQKAKELGVRVPESKLFEKDFTLELEFITGSRLRDTLHRRDLDQSQKEAFMKELGVMMATLHDNDIMHGDLTTSNVLVEQQTNQLVLIDFGLSFFSTRIEDKAVDIHLLEQVLVSTHHELQHILFGAFCDGYRSVNEYDGIIERLDVVRSRGRKKH